MSESARWASDNEAGTQCYEQGHYAEAERHFLAALQEVEQFGPHDTRLATVLNNLANLYHTQGTYAQAEPLYQRALAIREEILGLHHPIVAQSLNNLNNSTLDGKCYAACGRAYTESSTGNRVRFCSHANTKSNSSSMLWQR